MTFFAFSLPAPPGVDGGLLAELPALTTHPPNTNFLGGFMTSNAALGPMAPRDNASTPDLGWHYAPLDWALNVDVSNATLAVQPGTVLAACGPQFGIWLYTNGVFNSQGTAASPVYVVRYNTVQEQSNTNWESGSLAWDGSLTMPNQADSSRANCAFTKRFVLAGDFDSSWRTQQKIAL
jgi:hypothetical protein